jgi:hypothetical protein
MNPCSDEKMWKSVSARSLSIWRSRLRPCRHGDKKGQADLDTKLTAVLQRADGSLEQFECPYLIDAEGAHNIGRGTIGLHFEGKSHVESYALGHLGRIMDMSQLALNYRESRTEQLNLFSASGTECETFGWGHEGD